MSKIILDVRSGERNDSGTGLCLRVVDESTTHYESTRWERIGRDLYEVGSNGVSDYALIASGDGEIGVEEVDVGFVHLSGNLYLTNSRSWLSEVRDNSSNVLTHYFGGTVVSSEVDISGTRGVGTVDGLFWWTRNDLSRKRFEYGDRGWKLLSGGKGVSVGVVGDEEDLVLGSLDGELRIGGGDVSLPTVVVYQINGDEFKLAEEGTEDSVLGEDGVVGVVLNPSGKVLFKDDTHIGKTVLHISKSLVGGESLSSGDYLSPIPLSNEHPLLRQSGYGYSDVEFVATEANLGETVDYGKVKISRDSGRVLCNGTLLYDGLVLCDTPVGVGDGVDLGNTIGSVQEVPVMDVPDGSGLEPNDVANSFRPNGRGLKWEYRWLRMYVSIGGTHILPVKIVDKLPKKLSLRSAYILRGERKVRLSTGWRSTIATEGHKLFSGHVSLNRKGLAHTSGQSLLNKTGTFNIDGSSLSFNGVSLSGAGSSLASVVRDHLVINSGSSVDHPSNVSEMETLKSISLVPSSSLESGVEFVLTRSSVKGYYSYDEENVSDISGSTTFQILQFEPRVDFSGYASGQFFKVGDKILGTSEIETAFGESPNGFHWITQRSVSGVISQETSRINLGAGIRVNMSSTLTITQEQLDGTIDKSELVQDTNYDYPSNGLEGQARLISRLGTEKLRGQAIGSVVNNQVDLQVDLSSIKAGDFYYDGINYFKIENVSGTVVDLSSVLDLQNGRWKIYEGYREGVQELETPDPTKIVGEILDSVSVLERRSVEVYKVYTTLAFDKVLPSSSLYIRKTENNVENTYPLTVLRDDVLQSPYELPNDVHYSEDSYRIKILGVEYTKGVLIEGKGFTVSDNRVVFQPDSSWVEGEIIYVRKPRSGLSDTSEMDLSLNIEAPFTPSNVFDSATMSFLELLSNPRVESTSGAISFEDPLEEGVGVEVSYTPQDAPEARIIEEMGFITLQEEAVKVNDNEYTYNPKNKKVELLATPTVFLGAEVLDTSDYLIDQNSIKFARSVSSTVRVSYTTLQSNGGDGSVRTSSGMVVPKYKISKGTTSLSVHRDLTSILETDDLIRVGLQIFYVSSISANEITVSPSARTDIETDTISFLNVPKFTYDSSQNSYAFRSVSGAVISSKPKSPDIFIQGDYRDFIKSSSLIILQNIPYRVKVVGLDEATGTTKISVEGFTTGHDYTSTDDFLISFRSILIENDKNLSLSTGLIDTEDFQLIKYDHSLKRGRLLSSGQDYRLNSEAGLIDLIGNHSVKPQISYYLLHTSLSSVKPITLLGGRVSKPTYNASFNQSKTPDSYDGLGLNVKCVVSSPDTFQLRIVDEDVYSSEIANELQQSLNQNTGSGGKLVVSSPTSQGKAIGVFDLLANDVVARSRINLYNGYIQSLDDLISTTTGKIVGDNDGSFKFNLLTGGDWISPGLEDSITREIYPRYVSMEYLTPLNSSNPYPTPDDSIFIDGVDEDDLSKYLNSILHKQKSLIENEMDDYVLIGQRVKKSFDLNVGLPYIKTEYIPVYRQMWQRHRFSRLFPTTTKMYTTRTPGKLTSETNGTVIGNVQNNALDQIENITSLSIVSKRAARFRVYDFSLNGYAAAPDSVGKPTFIVSAVPFDEFPIDPSTGLPDTSELISSGTGTIADATVGNIDRTYNGLTSSSKVKLSQNGDQFYDVINTAQEATLLDLGLFPPLPVRSEPRYAKVKQVIDGCYVVLDGNAFTLKINGKSLAEKPPKRGDTLLESFSRDLDDDTSPSTYFRVGSDIGIKRSTGELVDITLPSIDDPNWPVKEIVGQNVPASGIALEGDVEFTYTETSPFKYPALDGEHFDDTGDESIPFKSRFNERDLLPQIPPALDSLQVQTNSQYVYPDEARGTASIGSGVLTTNEDFSSLSGVCEQSPRQGDLVILKPDDGHASTGIMEIAEINGTTISPPIFSNTSKIEYNIDNLIVQLTGIQSEGVLVKETFIKDSNGDWSSSLVRLAFNNLPDDTIETLFDKVSSDGGTINVQLHQSTTPYENRYTFSFERASASWTITLRNEATNHQTQFPGNIVISGNLIQLLQDPINNILTNVEYTNGGWLDYTKMVSWLFDNNVNGPNFWSSMSFISEDNGNLKHIISSTDNTTQLYFDYRLSVANIGRDSVQDTISSNRIGITTFDTLFNNWFQSHQNSNIVGSTNTTRAIDIINSHFIVNQEDGGGTFEIQSNVNNRTFTDFEIVDNLNLKFKALDGVSRTNDPMSIFIGSEVDETDTILQGNARYGLVSDDGITDTGIGVLRNIVVSDGSINSVLAGDLLYIENGYNAGTHRVLANISLDGTETFLEQEKTEVLGSSQVYKVQFPKIVSLDTSTNTLTTDVSDLTDYFISATGTFYVLMSSDYTNKPRSIANGIDMTDPAVPVLDYVKDQDFGATVIKVDYTAISESEFTINPNTISYLFDPNGSLLSIVEFNTLLESYQQTIGGIDKIPFNLNGTGEASGIPVSFDVELSLSFTVGGGYTGSTSASNTPANPYNDGNVVRNSNNVPTHILLDTTDTSLFPLITDTPNGDDYGSVFLTPNDTITATIKVNEGIYLDPTFPLLVRDYTGAISKKFNDGTSQVRSLVELTATNLPAPFDFYEVVSFKVRRLRRFTDVFSKLIYAFEGFRYLYEQRVGRVDSVVYANGLITLTPRKVDGEGVFNERGTDTQVGDFSQVVSVGDLVQCLNSSNQETLYLRVLEVGSTLKCVSIRGVVSDVSQNDVFKIITRTPLIPELQAFDQFLYNGFTQIYSSEPVNGISVQEENKLTDTNVSFLTLNVSVGDFLVIDSQGELTGSNPPEFGKPPQGDNGTGALGDPNVLDDNRGSYKITTVEANTLTVEFYAGNSGHTRTDYNLLPSVQGDSSQPLRITSGIVGSSYATTTDSIHPFSYRILRRNETLDESLAGSFLFFRERTLSWVEIIRSFNQLPTNPYTWSQYEDVGLINEVGVSDSSHPSNDVLIQNILGNQDSRPFQNNETCLSVFDRRMLIEDPKMISENYGTPEDGLPTVLENDISSMNARDKRYAWISIRTDQINGTLPKLSRVDLDNPDDTALEDIK